MEAITESTFAERAARHANSPRATAAHVKDGQLYVTVVTGATLHFPARLLRPLADLSDEQLEQVRIAAGGTTLMWRNADVDISVAGLLEAVTGLQIHQTTARKGGIAKTPAKASAARANGGKGGKSRKAKAAT